MITCATYENLSEASHAFLAQFILRHKCFIDRLHYDAGSDGKVRSYNRMEYDKYDTPAAVYLVYLSPEGEAWGCSRLTPVAQGCMLTDLWPELVSEPEAIIQPGVWEGTRFCIDQDLPMAIRQQVCRELVLAYLELGLAIGIKHIIGVMPPFILRRVFGANGCHFEKLGQPLRIPSGDVIAAGCMAVTAAMLAQARSKTGIEAPVLHHASVQKSICQAA